MGSSRDGQRSFLTKSLDFETFLKFPTLQGKDGIQGEGELSSLEEFSCVGQLGLIVKIGKCLATKGPPKIS